MSPTHQHQYHCCWCLGDISRHGIWLWKAPHRHADTQNKIKERTVRRQRVTSFPWHKQAKVGHIPWPCSKIATFLPQCMWPAVWQHRGQASTLLNTRPHTLAYKGMIYLSLWPEIGIHICLQHITVNLREHYGTSDHWQLNCLFNSFLPSNKGNIKVLHNWPFVGGIHQWLLDSSHKGPTMWSVLYHDRR